MWTMYLIWEILWALCCLRMYLQDFAGKFLLKPGYFQAENGNSIIRLYEKNLNFSLFEWIVEIGIHFRIENCKKFWESTDLVVKIYFLTVKPKALEIRSWTKNIINITVAYLAWVR